jgi:hypothetical protein
MGNNNMKGSFSTTCDVSSRCCECDEDVYR